MRDAGTGPVVVLLHGVGVGPDSFDTVVEQLVSRHRVVVLRRPRAAAVAEQAAAVVAAIRSLDSGPVTLTGVSGGATVSLAAAMASPAVVGAVVAHEPLLGAHAQALHGRITAVARALATGDITSREWFRSLVGPRTWARLPPELDGADVGAEEVAPFAAWSPEPAALDSLRRLNLTTTVGEWSGPARHEAARVLAERAGAEVIVLPGSGHLPQLEDPCAFAQVVAGEAARVRV